MTNLPANRPMNNGWHGPKHRGSSLVYMTIGQLMNRAAQYEWALDIDTRRTDFGFAFKVRVYRRDENDAIGSGTSDRLQEALRQAIISASMKFFPFPQTAPRERRQWSIYGPACLDCGRTDVRHHGYGYCATCLQQPGRLEFLVSNPRKGTPNNVVSISSNPRKVGRPRKDSQG